jgi:hypothetical protein
VTLTLVIKHWPREGTVHRQKIHEAFGAAASFDGARLMVFGDAQIPEVELPTLVVSSDQSTLERALWIRGEFSKGDLVHCLDMEAAFELLSSRVNARVILDPQVMPSLSYQDESSEVEPSVLKHLIDREERVLNRCSAVLYANLYTRKLLGIRGVRDEQLRLQKDVLVAPRRSLTHQSMVQLIYQHERLDDARVVYEALQRLRVPWRISVIADCDESRRFWLRDRRVRVIEKDKDWQTHLGCSMVAVCGGSNSVGASSGLTLPRLAFWSAHFGVSVIGTENAQWRMLLSGAGLVPSDRPDLMAEALMRLITDETAREEQHRAIVDYYEANVQDVAPNFLRDLWRELGA